MSNIDAENEPQIAPPTPPTSAHSRRDFLRRAGTQAVKEAVEMGTKVVPGGALVRQFVKSAEAEAEEIDSAAYDPLALPPKPEPTLLQNPLGWLSAWRRGRRGDDE